MNIKENTTPFIELIQLLLIDDMNGHGDRDYTGTSFDVVFMNDTDKEKLRFLASQYQKNLDSWEDVTFFWMKFVQLHCKVLPVSDDNHEGWRKDDVYGTVIGMRDSNIRFTLSEDYFANLRENR